ncbi:hypothetical protein KFU94_38320 [Chloroflexi bacterium TSY]|nr:hypothetical protein [Chloroflexi bacterium TSY]
MTISPEMVEVLKETKAMLSGYERRHFMAQTVKTICEGSPTKAERELGWNRATIAKALEELEGGFCYVDQSHRRGRKAEDHIPLYWPIWLKSPINSARPIPPFDPPNCTLD